MSHYSSRILIVAVLLSLSFQSFGSATVKASSPIETMYSGLSFPVAFAFVPDGRIFYNEKDTGNVRVIQSGAVLPATFANVGPLPGVGGTEEGLLGIVLDPNFNSNHYVYVYWTYFNAIYKQVKITRWTASGNSGGNRRDIFNFTDPNPLNRQPQVGGPTNHNGGYMKFGPDGKLYFEVGDFCSWDCLSTPLAQHLDTYAGKILRMNPDGTVPSDNPTIGDSQHRLIWAYGYRNGFGMGFSSTGRLIATMAGPNCCDRLFFVSNSTNFGWPNCGTDSRPACLTLYAPSIFQTGPTVTPTGITWYSSNPNILYFGEENTSNFMQLIITPSGIGEISTIFSANGGIVAVEKSPDGRIYFSTGAGTIYRYTPPPLTLSLTPNSPINGTVLDNTLPNLQVRATINNANVPGVNVTISVNETEICGGQSDAAGIFGCGFQIVKQGTYAWNATGVITASKTELDSYFIVGLVASVPLVEGWNLISLPIVPANSLIGKVFRGQIANQSLGVVWSYQQGAWKFSNGGVSGTLTTMPDGFGYWVYTTKPSELHVTGFIIPPGLQPPSYQLNQGWNLVGFKPEPNVATENVGDYLTSISGSYDTNNVWLHDNTGGSWIRANPSTPISPGEAMWVLMSAPATLRP
ncbi:MAG: PQQ-dependent sugar dehydrogenase [Candidatus Bathyarchaeia archaeon]